MPELPEVETIKRGLSKYILNKKIVQVEQRCDKSFIANGLDAEGAKAVDLRRRGKALLVDLDNNVTMMIHLRMTGQLIWRGNAKNGSGTKKSLSIDESPLGDAEQFAAGHPSENFVAELPNGQTRVQFVFEEGNLYFNDQRKFGFVKLLPTSEVEKDKFIAELGPEPWEMADAAFYEKCQRHKKAPIKAVLLNQKIIAGLGNIYADESLFYAKVHPETPAGLLSEEETSLILEGARKVMDASINSGGSTMATYVRADGTRGNYLEKFAQVFRREGKECPRCGAEIVKMRVAGRGTHICPHCQRKLGNDDN